MKRQEQVFNLKDGRIIYKTHNGFKFWVTNTKGKDTQVSKEYWKKVFKNRV